MQQNSRIIRFILLGMVVALGVGLLIYWLKKERKPSIEKACRDFQEIYPKVKILGIEISHDDDHSRGFLLRYLKPGQETGKTIEVQFMKHKQTGKWTLSPTPPTVLA